MIEEDELLFKTFYIKHDNLLVTNFTCGENNIT